MLCFCVSPVSWIDVHKFESWDQNYPAPLPGIGAGLSGAPPTETGPTNGGGGGIIFRDVRISRARGFGCGMLEVVNGMVAFCRASVCAASEESWRDSLFKSVC